MFVIGCFWGPLQVFIGMTVENGHSISFTDFFMASIFFHTHSFIMGFLAEPGSKYHFWPGMASKNSLYENKENQLGISTNMMIIVTKQWYERGRYKDWVLREQSTNIHLIYKENGCTYKNDWIFFVLAIHRWTWIRHSFNHKNNDHGFTFGNPFSTDICFRTYNIKHLETRFGVGQGLRNKAPKHLYISYSSLYICK